MKVFAAGTIHYRAYRRQDGVMVPFEQTVTLTPPESTVLPLEENYNNAGRPRIATSSAVGSARQSQGGLNRYSVVMAIAAWSER